MRRKRSHLMMLFVLLCCCSAGLATAANTGKVKFVDVEDAVRDFLESKKFLVSPTFEASPDRKGVFVYCPKGFDSIVKALSKMPSVDSMERPPEKSLALAKVKIGAELISLSQTWEPWVTVLFPPQ